jgi:hypothetical protein
LFRKGFIHLGAYFGEALESDGLPGFDATIERVVDGIASISSNRCHRAHDVGQQSPSDFPNVRYGLIEIARLDLGEETNEAAKIPRVGRCQGIQVGISIVATNDKRKVPVAQEHERREGPCDTSIPVLKRMDRRKSMV